MARYSVAWWVQGVSSQALAWLRSTASKDIRVWEIGIFADSGTQLTAGPVGLGRPAAISATPTTLVPIADDSSAGNPAILAATGGSTKPTSPATFMRRFGMPATLGAGIIWTFPQGLVVPTGPSELVVWNIGTATHTFSGYFIYEE